MDGRLFTELNYILTRKNIGQKFTMKKLFLSLGQWPRALVPC